MISWGEWSERRRQRHERESAAASSAFQARWHSFDRHPWEHPWITPDNLRAMRDFSRRVHDQVRRFARARPPDYPIGFVGNMANSMYSSAVAMRSTGTAITVFPHPSDDYIMSQPEWEEFDGSLDLPTHTLAAALAGGIVFPPVAGVERCTSLDHRWAEFAAMPPFVKPADHARYAPYFALLPLLTRLRDFDALFATQSPYIAYLTGRPYMVTHAGGDIWFECSRDDQLGHLQRAAFRHASLVIASNPWSYAFARRYGLTNMVYVPTLLDPDFYSPGEPDLRPEWQQRAGGDFFILSTARVDDFYKGSNIAFEAASRFLRRHPNARLVQIAWGSDLERHYDRVRALGLEGQVVFLPPAGKRRLVRYMRAAHVLIDQFKLGYYGMTALEAMATGLPVIMNLRTAQYDAFSDAATPPVCNADNALAIEAHLEALLAQPGRRQQLADEQRAWFMRYSGAPEWPELYQALLSAVAAGHRFNYRRSPLRAPLTDAERRYHDQELAAAPVFPNYL